LANDDSVSTKFDKIFAARGPAMAARDGEDGAKKVPIQNGRK
jgi:hypothetical protein